MPWNFNCLYAILGPWNQVQQSTLLLFFRHFYLSIRKAWNLYRHLKTLSHFGCSILAILKMPKTLFSSIWTCNKPISYLQFVDSMVYDIS